MPAPLALFRAEMQRHRDEYLRSLPGRLEQLEAHWLATCRGDALAQATLSRCAHSLAGSAAVFGLPELGDAARTLELLLDRLRPAGGAPAAEPPSVRFAFEALREQLRLAVAAVELAP